MQSTPSMQSMKRDEVKGLKLSGNMERDMNTVEEVIVKQGKKRPNWKQPAHLENLLLYLIDKSAYQL